MARGQSTYSTSGIGVTTSAVHEIVTPEAKIGPGPITIDGTVGGVTILGEVTAPGFNVLPDQAGNSGKALSTNGTTPSWIAFPEELPTQTSHSGEFLTTNGTAPSWIAFPEELPTQTSHSGEFLTTNGTAPAWAAIPNEVPAQTGHSGEFLTTDGSALSWGTVQALPDQSTAAGQFLTSDGTNASWADLPGPVLGLATLTAGTVTITEARTGLFNPILVTCGALGTVTVPQAMAVVNRVDGVSFDIISADNTDTSTVSYVVY